MRDSEANVSAKRSGLRLLERPGAEVRMQWLDTIQFFVLLFRSDQEILRWLVLPKSSTFIRILSCLMGKVRR
jgi:hypothetical protein